MFRWLLNRAVDTEQQILQRNFVVNIFDGALFAFGMSLVSLQTVLPVFVKRMGGSAIAVGLIPVLWTFGFNFPQILIANYVQRIPFKKKLFLKTALFQRMPWFLLALMVYFIISHVDSSVGIMVFFILFFLAAVAGSINLPIWFDLIAKLTPVGLRGRLFAARNVLGGVLGVLGGWIVERVLETIEYPTNFALLFVFATCGMMLSYIFLTMLKEGRAVMPLKHIEYKEYFLNLPEILKHQKNFRNFLISDALLIAATMSSAFYAVHAIDKFSLSDSSAGVFTIVIMATTIIGNLFFGSVADQFGHKVNLLFSAGSTALSCLIALFASTAGFYLIVFIGSALTVGLTGISRLAIVAELCSEEERPTYVALTNMVTAPFVLFGIAAGWIVNRFGYDTVFTIAACLAIASALWLALKVDEPRGKHVSSILERVQYQV